MSKSYPINCAGKGSGKLPPETKCAQLEQALVGCTELPMAETFSELSKEIESASDLDKAKLCLALLQSMRVKRASTLDALEDEIEYIKAIVG